MLNVEDIKILSAAIAHKYHVKRLELFGSYANGTATEGSDADFLVEFSVPVPSIFTVMGFRRELEAHLGIPVDVVTLPLQNPAELMVSRTETII